jgi:hypothetical protein
MAGARLKGDVERCYLGSGRWQFVKCFDLGMRQARGMVVSLGENATSLYDHRAHGRIRGSSPQGLGGFLDRETHEALV